MRFKEFNQPAVGDIVEIELGEELVEAIITAIGVDEIVVETDSISGANLLVESYGKYWCSTDKKWKERKGPKQTRNTESIEEAHPNSKIYDKCWDGYKKVPGKKRGEPGSCEKISESIDVNELAKISDEALDKAYGYGRSSPGNTFGWKANVMSATYAKKLIDAGETDIEKISDAIHKGWNVTAQKFVQDPDQFDDTEKLRAAGKLDAKLAQRAKLMKINYAQLPEDEKEKDRVVARALLDTLSQDSQDKEITDSVNVNEAEYQGRNVPLGKPMQGDVKKFKVYVRDPQTGNVKKVNFGDPNMRIKKSNPKRRKSFRARHNCSNPGPRTKARYWSCRKW